MAPSTSSFLAMAVVAMAAVLLQTSSANPPPAAPPAVARRPAYCSYTLYRLFDCLDFLQIGANMTGPPASCCAPLREVVSSPAAICLCHAVGSGLNAFAGVNIDPIRLAILPAVCFAIVPPQLPVMCFVGPVPPIYTFDQPGTPPPAMTPPPPPPAMTPPPPPPASGGNN